MDLTRAGCFSFLLCAAAAWTAPLATYAQDDLSSLTDGNVEKVAGEMTFTEGPAWHPDGYLLFSDIPNERVLKLQDGQVTNWWTNTGRANGLMCDQQGVVYACQGGAGQISRIENVNDGPTVLAGNYREKRFNSPNDLCLDNHGGLYFTDPMYGQGQQTQPVQGVYYISHQGEVTLVVDSLPRPNGVLVSADGSQLYVANPNERQIVRYDITGPGKVSGGEVIFTGDESVDGNGPDGMAFDEKGNLYATYQQLVVLNHDGKLIGRVEIPEKPSNCAFGGDDRKTLYITARTSLYSLPMKVAGLDLREKGPQPSARGSAGNTQRNNANEQNNAAAKSPETRQVQVQQLTLQIPTDWQQEQPSSNMRIGQFRVPAASGSEPAEMVIFPQFGGSAQANIDRWIGQFDASDRDIKITQGSADDGAEYVLVDLTGTYQMPDGPPFLQRVKPMPDYRVLNVIYTPPSGGSYYFKLVGPKETVSKADQAFRQSFGGDESNEKPYEKS